MPKRFKDHKVTCIDCGEEFLTKANNTRRCPTCRYVRSRKQALDRYYAKKAGTYEPKRAGRPKKNPKLMTEAPEIEPQYQSKTICWKCANAVPGIKWGREYGCSWSRDFVPVDGWDATKGKKGYEVHKCPKFIPDEEAKRRGKGRPMLQVDKDSLIREILPDEMSRYWMREGM